MGSAEEMVERIKSVYGLTSFKVLHAILIIPRHLFVDNKYRIYSYFDRPLPIGYNQTISQPYTVAFMTQLVVDAIKKNGVEFGKVLEIGTGSGYQAAVLSQLFRFVYTIEVVAGLAKKAVRNLRRAGIKNVTVKNTNGIGGWKEKSPFDAIIITANINHNIPKVLFKRLKEGGVLVAPVDGIMKRFIKSGDNKYIAKSFGRFDFVPFVGS